QQIIDDMVDIARKDSPWVWGLHPKQFTLYHSWYHNVKPNLMANNTLKYKKIDPEKREKLRRQWNQPVIWPIILTIVVLIVAIVPAVNSYRAKIHARGVR
ncbi:MAG: peptide ABC transporter substrate-binding protein, partial [Gammaproteobacteria bacterium]